MKKTVLICMFLATLGVAWGQNERKVIRQGVRAYQEGDYSEAEVQFRKAGDINQESLEAGFNTGAALYGQEKYEETFKQYESLVEQSQGALEEDPETLAHIWHNMGNSLLESQQYGPSIEAYKNSLRLNPDDFDSKYNLAYARKKLKEQQQQQDQQGENDQQKDQQQQEKQQDQKKGQGDQNEDDRLKNEDPQEQPQQEQTEQEQQAQPQPREISKEDAERMLKAIQQQEKDVKDKVDKKKAAAAKVKTKKDW
jgi:Ca-activated chloride channel family protein